jgi:hypothetical protein
LLTYFENPFLRPIEVGNQLYNYRKCEGDGKDRERSARANHTRVIAHCSKGKSRDREKANPDCTGNAASEVRLYPFRVQIDHLVERLDE